MRKSPLNKDKINELREDKKNGMSIQDLAFKYNLCTSAIYKYLKEEISYNIEEKKDNTENNDNNDDNYLDKIIVKDDNENDNNNNIDNDNNIDKNDDIIIEINQNIKEKKRKSKKIIKENEEKQEKKNNDVENLLLKENNIKYETSKNTNNDKVQKIMKIRNYCLIFNKKISQILPIETEEKLQKYITSLYKMSIIQLDVQIELIRVHIGKISSYKGIKLSYLGLIELVEKLGGRMIDIENFRRDIEDNDEIDNLLKEISCEYDIFNQYTRPELRLVALTGLQLMSTYKKNKIIKQQQDIINKLNVDKNINQDIEEKYNDI